MNKIKFEHGGGDGLEFGTFNSEKTSIFTNEYRFNKNGIWKMATRETESSGKDIIDEGTIPTGKSATGLLKYKKNNVANNQAKTLADLKTYEAADDFYDFIDVEDVQTTTESIVKTASALNNDFIETSQSSKKNLSIGARSTYKIIEYTDTLSGNELTFTIDDLTKSYFKDELKLILSGSTKLSDYIDTKQPFLINGTAYRLSGDITPKVSIESEEEVDLDAKYGDIVITSGDTIKQEAPEIRLNAIKEDKTGGMVNFGATQDVVFLTNKLTKSLNVEAATTPVKLKLQLQNNYQEPVFWDNSIGKFRIPLKKIYLDNQHTEELTPVNYANGLAVYFEDGTRVPADYTCFIGYTLGTGVTKIYKVGTKGSDNVLKKTLGDPVAEYYNTSGNISTGLGTETNNTISNIKFELPTYDGQGTITVAPEEFVSMSEINIEDLVETTNTISPIKETVVEAAKMNLFKIGSGSTYEIVNSI